MSTLKERNAKVIKRALNESPEMKAMRESMKRNFNIDPVTDTEKFPVLKESFSWRKLERKLHSELREADAQSSFVQFLRAGIQQIVNSLYESTPSTYDRWVTVVQSNKDTELYAPNMGVSFPRQVGPSEKYPEVSVAALDIKLKNLKFGSMYALEKELLDDDQSGSFQRQAGVMGEYMKLLSEVLCYGKLASVSNMKYIDYSIPVSETKPSEESVYPWSTSLVGGGSNRPSSFEAFSQAAIQNGFIKLMNQKNKQGIKMLVEPDLIAIGPTFQFDAAILLHSAYYPSGAAASGNTNTGGAFAINPIKSIADLVVSRFMFKNDGSVDGTSKAWYLMDSKKPWFVHQIREAISVEQEAPNAGASFELDHIRFKGRSRMNADFIDPRFAYQGNDGSV